MRNYNKREQILDAMRELMGSSNAQAISISDVAQKAGIRKGSIYCYFSSKNDIIDAVIERLYPRVLDAGKESAAPSHMDAFKRVELICHTCLDSSAEPRRQEATGAFGGQQESVFIRQKLARVVITRLKPILTDIICQGMEEGTIYCEYPEETVQIVLTVLAITLDNDLIPADQDQTGCVFTTFTQIQEKGMDISAHIPEFVLRKN